jgi:hypothetical protein
MRVRSPRFQFLPRSTLAEELAALIGHGEVCEGGGSHHD